MTTTTNESEPFRAWRDAECTSQEALHALCNTLGEVESQIAPLTAEKEQARNEISYILAAANLTAHTVAGFGKLEVTPATMVKGWDSKALQNLMDELLFESPDLAARLQRCRTQTSRAGSLRITRERGTK